MTKNLNDNEYSGLCLEILNEGMYREDRTGVGTYSVFGRQMRFKINDGANFPLMTTKKVYWKGIVEELLWFISGDTNANTLSEKGVNIWQEWADEDGELGPIYGFQWRSWPSVTREEKTIDQLQEVIDGIKNNPYGRRHIVSAWNVSSIEHMNLPPCHMMFQFYADPESNKLSMMMYQRSCDMFLGVPFNIASYSLLLKMVAQVTGYEADEFIWVGGDCHIYTNHLDQIKTQLSRVPYHSPRVTLNPLITDIDEFTSNDISLKDYEHHPKLTGKVAV